MAVGEIEVISDCKSSQERKGRTALLKKIAYYRNTYSNESLKNFYSACLRQVRQGEKSWSDDLVNKDIDIIYSAILPRPCDSGDISQKVKDANVQIEKTCKAKFPFLHTFRSFIDKQDHCR